MVILESASENCFSIDLSALQWKAAETGRKVEMIFLRLNY